MKAFRLIIKQTSANYRKPEAIKNKMTYPLPPFSTVIGALHNACGYTEYKEMNLSIQGKYESMHREPYTDYCFLNRLEDDRGILVWLPNASFFSNAFVRVAHAQKSQGNSFRKGVTIQVEDQKLLDEYRRLKDLNDTITEFKKTRLNPVFSLIKKRKKTLKEKKKARKQEGLDCTAVFAREKELKEIEKQIKERFENYKYENYTEPLSHFRNLVKSVKYYEILNNIELVIHVQASDEVLHDLEEHWMDIKSIGRSEDMVDVQEAKIVELLEEGKYEVKSIYSAYLDANTMCTDPFDDDYKKIYPKSIKDSSLRGTKYYLNKNYTISPETGKRIFEKKKVIYTSRYAIKELGNGIYLDIDEASGKKYIVNFIDKNERQGMDKSEYWAKDDGTTLEKHINDVKDELFIIKELGYITSEESYELIKLAIEYHDLGKVNSEFQHRVREKEKHLKFDPEKEVVHNVLSLYFIDKKKVQSVNPKDEKNYYRVCFAVLFHHNYGDTLELFRKNENRSLEVLKEFKNEIFPVNVEMDIAISAIIKTRDEMAIKIKGFLQKCDYAASGHYPVEFRNDFLLSGLEYLLKKWNESANKKKQDIQSTSKSELSKQDKNGNEGVAVDWNTLQYFCKEKQNQNIIVVAQTGMGKTEAGLLWIGNHKGFFVLPIRTAINAIYDRVRKGVLENSDKIDEQVGILHSEQLEYYTENIEGSDEDIYEYVKRGKQLSLPLNISTLDQLFDFIFQYPGYELKLATLSYSRIVIDEIQMYNAELLAYLIFGLEKIVKMGGKVAILTATLPPFVKELLEQHLGIPKENQKVFIDDKKARHHIKVCDKKINAEDIVKLYLKNREEGKSNPHKGNKILVVCNKIKTAQKLFDDVNELIKAKYDKEEIHIFHSRFTKEDREELEKEIIEFGKSGNESEDINRKDGIWIATSVVEASLDIDFDYLVTELQDLCSLLQRMGRCNRKGLKSISEPNCYIYLQIDSEDLIGTTRRTGRKGKEKVYGFIDSALYELSKKAISEHEGILTESQKQEMLQRYFTTENMQNSHFMKSFKKTYKYVSEIVPYSYQKNEKKLREIVTETIIPGPVYEEKSTQILECVQKLKQPELSVVQRQKLRNQIMKYTVNVPYYHWKSYQDALNSKKASVRKAKYYEPIQIGKYEKIKVMECNYDKKGYSPIEWTKKTEEDE